MSPYREKVRGRPVESNILLEKGTRARRYAAREASKEGWKGVDRGSAPKNPASFATNLCANTTPGVAMADLRIFCIMPCG